MPSATLMRTGSHGEEAFYSPTGSGFVPDDHAEPDAVLADAPVHPVQSLQASFEESILESTDEPETPGAEDETAETRRQALLETEVYDQSWQARWKLRNTSKYHPLLKLVSQIVFGLHLLQQQQAKSEGEVVKILQAHVNEVDSFLERTSQDLDLAIKDIQERIRHLRLPMEHKDVFEVMLDDKAFRTQLIDGNDKIEGIIDRTTKVMHASLYDLQECVKANKELANYLDGVRDQWPKEKRVISEVFSAMRGNEHGWTRYIADLETKATKLRKFLIKLTSLLGEMSMMAAAASQRNKAQAKAQNRAAMAKAAYTGSKSAPTSPGLRPNFHDEVRPPMPTASERGVNSAAIKPLPREPSQTMTSRDVMPSDRTERTGQAADTAERPRTAGGSSTRKARDADSRANTSDLAAFFAAERGPANSTHQNPLRSNPPDDAWRSYSTSGEPQSTANGFHKGPARSKSQDILKSAEHARAQFTVGSDGTSSLRPSTDQNDAKPTLHSTGFARRLSRRMKHLQAQEGSNPALTPTISTTAPEPYPDSAYASGPDSSSSAEKKKRPESILGPLPGKGMEPLFASTYTEPRPNREASKDGTNQSVRSLAPTGKSKHSTLKSVFQKKWSSGRKLFAS